MGEDGEGRRADLVVAANVVVPERDLHVLGEGGLRRVDEQLLVVEVWTGAAVVDSFATLLVLPELNDGIRILLVELPASVREVAPVDEREDRDTRKPVLVREGQLQLSGEREALAELVHVELVVLRLHLSCHAHAHV